MKRHANQQPETERAEAAWTATVARRGAAFAYPPTPDIAAGVARQLADTPVQNRRINNMWRIRPQLAWSLLVLLLVMGGLLLSAPLRAALLDFLQIGAVRIQLPPTAPTEGAPTTGASTPDSTPDSAAVFTARPPTATPQVLGSWLNLQGETTLAEARARLSIPLRLPTYPADLGVPDRVFVQTVGGSGAFALFIWLEPDQQERPRLTLMQMEPSAFVTKGEPTQFTETRVHGHRAIWTSGPYALIYRSRGTLWERLIDGHVLIWSAPAGDQEATYRLESGLTLEEAVKVAESLREIDE